MAVDNLPCELPKDASFEFGKMFIDHVLEPLTGNDPENIIYRASETIRWKANSSIRIFKRLSRQERLNLFSSAMVLAGSSDLNTKLPATKTSAPQSISFLALAELTPPSISILVDSPALQS